MSQPGEKDACAVCRKPIEPGHSRFRTGQTDLHLGCSVSTAVPTGKATVLVVDDEPEMRDVLREILAPRAYAVLDTGDPEEAVRIAGEFGRPIHVLLTDVVMPKIEGPELAERVGPLRPQMKIVFMSGYEVVDRLKPGAVFLPKPFTVKELMAQLEA
jgi:two-component system cell cycle sensor histidine kinase/response regulator CckA